MYEVLDALLIRASTHPDTSSQLPWPDLAGTTDADLVRWLATVWVHESISEAIATASPALADQVCRLLAATGVERRELERAVLSAARYVLRATGRSTPFGMFAGAAPVALGAAGVRWGSRHQRLTQADRAWLTEVITAFEDRPAVLRRLPVVLNDLAEVSEDRVVLSGQSPAAHNGRRAEASALVDVTVRRTVAVTAVMTHARTPIVVSDLLEKLTAEFPNASTTAAESAIAQLVRARVLLTSLRPPTTAGDGLAHVLTQLAAAEADTLPEITRIVRDLRAIADRMRYLDGDPSAVRHPAERRRGRLALVEQMDGVHGGHDRPVAVDLRLDADITLPDRVIRHARAAAAALTRLTPYPRGLPAWQEYHEAFLDCYGVGAVVPLPEVVDPDVGLGLPATYRGSSRAVAAAPLSDRDRGLLRLAQTAIAGGGNEIVLDDAAIEKLAGPSAMSAQAPPHVELFVQIHADSVDALWQGKHTSVVSGASRAVGSTVGRFLRLLAPAERDRVRDAYSAVATGRAGAMPVQVSCPPLLPSSEHLASAPLMLPTVLSAGEFADRGDGDDVLRLSDVAVGADADGMFLVSMRHQRLIEPTVLNAVEFRFFSHPLVRFLCEAPRATAAVYMPFSWGAAESLPALPRVRHGRVVLAPARWNLLAADLPQEAAASAGWRAALTTWREQFGVPDRVCLVEGDSALPLNLTEGLHQELLRRSLVRHGHARLDEASPPDAYGWLDGHAHEITIPLTSTQPATAAPAFARGCDVVRRDDSHVPGASPWLYAKLYTSSRRTIDVLDDVADLVAGCDGPGDWWYLPYRDPEPHLRLRIPLTNPDAYGPTATRLGAWAVGLRARGLLGRLQLDTYHPETGRYGRGDAMAAAERVFAADSTAALAEITATAAAVPADAVTAASLVDLTIAFTGDTATGMRWIVRHLPHEAAPIDRAVRVAAVHLADPSDNWAALRAIPGHGPVLQSWERRRGALAEYRDRLAPQREPHSVLPSLLHLHSVRVHGIDRDRERRCRSLARAAALRWSALHPAATP